MKPIKADYRCMKAILLSLIVVCSFSRSLWGAGGTVIVYSPWSGIGCVTNVPIGLSNAVAVAAGLDDAQALLNDGTVVAWGIGDYGQTNVPAGLSNVVAISSGWAFNMALKAEGTVVTWGFPIGEISGMPAGLSNVVAIAAGGQQFCLALRADTTVVAWGCNGSGQTDVPIGLTNVISIAAGLDHSLALRNDGTVIAWGGGNYGETNVPANLSNVVAIAAGWSQSFALRADGTCVGWGMDATNIPFNLSNVVAIAGGWDAGQEILFSNGTLLWDGWAGWSNVMAIARGHFFTVAIVGPNGPGIDCNEPVAHQSWMNGCFEGSVATRNGRVYTLQYKNLLTDGQWIAMPLAGGNGQIQWLKDNNASSPQRFYRVLRW